MTQLNGIDFRVLKKLEFHTKQVHVVGGLCKTPLPITIKEIPAGKMDGSGVEVQHMYVRISTNDNWLMQATTGHRRASDSFGPNSLLKVLREQTVLACDGKLPVNDPHPVAQSEDPMDAINVMEMETPQKLIRGDGLKRRRYYHNCASHKILALSMPSNPPELMEQGDETRTITLWVGDRKSIWLHQDDVEWAVRYLWVQSQLKGVPLVPSASEGPSQMLPFAYSASQGSPSRGSGASPVSNAEEIDLGIASPGEPVRLSRASSEDFAGTDADSSQDPNGADSQLLLF